MSKHVLSYFIRNPQAADSLEGVVRWRLLEETVHHTIEEADRALRWLVDHGFLYEVSTSAAGSIYALNVAKRAQAESFLSAWETSRGGHE